MIQFLSKSSAIVAALTIVSPALANNINIIADIHPIKALVRELTKGVAEPNLLISPNTSPHFRSLKPSQARMIRDADIIIEVGEANSPWLKEVFNELAPRTKRISLLDVRGTRLLNFNSDDDGHDNHADDHGMHSDDDRDNHKDEHGKHSDDDHDDHADEHGHDHGSGLDPHAWLSIYNAAVWASKITNELSKVDPANKHIYYKNLGNLRGDLAKLKSRIKQMLSANQEYNYYIVHDALSYFENEYGLKRIGILSQIEGFSPSVKSILKLRKELLSGREGCVIATNKSDLKRAGTLVNGTSFQNVLIDPLTNREPSNSGVDLAGEYGTLLLEIATKFRDNCAVR